MASSLGVDDAPFELDRLIGWVGGRTGVDPSDIDVVDLRVPPQTGFDSDIWFVRLAGADLPPEWTVGLVLRAKSHASVHEAALAEATLHDWLRNEGYPVPAILAVVEPGILAAGPVQIVHEVDGPTMLDAATRRPWSVGTLLRRFAELHVVLHRLPLEHLPPLPDVIDKRLRRPRGVAEALDHSGLRAGLAAVDELTPRLRDAPASLCHGDFHPLNALVADDGVAIIDWSDAGVGDRHCDVARTVALFDIASVVADSAFERRALGVIGPRLGRSYLRRYDALWGADPDRLALWTPLHLLHDWSQALDPSARDRAMPAAMADALQIRFEAALDAVGSGGGRSG